MPGVRAKGKSHSAIKENGLPALSPSLLVLGAMFLLSGAVALIYEAAWQREFTLLFGSSGPATAAVLAAYFAGLGLGAYIFGKFAPRLGPPIRPHVTFSP